MSVYLHWDHSDMPVCICVWFLQMVSYLLYLPVVFGPWTPMEPNVKRWTGRKARCVSALFPLWWDAPSPALCSVPGKQTAFWKLSSVAAFHNVEGKEERVLQKEMQKFFYLYLLHSCIYKTKQQSPVNQLRNMIIQTLIFVMQVCVTTRITATVCIPEQGADSVKCSTGLRPHKQPPRSTRYLEGSPGTSRVTLLAAGRDSVDPFSAGWYISGDQEIFLKDWPKKIPRREFWRFFFLSKEKTDSINGIGLHQMVEKVSTL